MQSDPRVITPRLILGLFLVLTGGALILGQLGILAVDDVTRYWPAALILLGLAMLQRGRGGHRHPFGGVFLIIAGVWLLFKTLGLVTLDPWEFLGPLVLVGLGLRILFRHEHARRPNALSADPAQPADASVNASADPISRHADLFAVLGGSHRRWDQSVFRSADTTSIMGGCELDLREALMDADNTADVDVFAMMGGLTLFVPPTWSVVLQVTPILGGVEDKSRGVPSAPVRTLFVRGMVIMGGVEIRN